MNSSRSTLIILLACIGAAILATTFVLTAYAQTPTSDPATPPSDETAPLPDQRVSPEQSPGPNPVTCAGYPEERVFLESQSWWVDKNHPFPGAHIHWGTCFPLLNEKLEEPVVTGQKIHFDVKLQLHDDPGTVTLLRVQIFEDGVDPTWSQTVSIRCPKPPAPENPTCVMWESFDVPLDNLPFDGRRELRMTANMGTGNTEPTHCCRMYNTTRWPMLVRNGKPVSNYPSANRVGAAGW